jgi:hypothetical protein
LEASAFAAISRFSLFLLVGRSRFLLSRLQMEVVDADAEVCEIPFDLA